MHEYTLTRSKRKTVSLSINQNLEIEVKAPLQMPLNDIENLVKNHAGWIEKHKVMIQEKNQRQAENKLTSDQIIDLKNKAIKFLPGQVFYYSQKMGVVPTGVKITAARTRWGSCSGKNSLCFSYRLMLLPPEIIDYIVVHELAHIRVKNHSAAFYREIEKYMPDYKERIKKLKLLQKELPY